MVYNLFGNQTAAYAITGSGNLTKLGPGKLSFTGNNSYTGTTTVAGGVLNINGGDSGAAFSVNSGTLYVNTTSPANKRHRGRRRQLRRHRVAGFGGSANVANGGILDFGQITGSTFYLNSLTYAGSSRLNSGCWRTNGQPPFRT